MKIYIWFKLWILSNENTQLEKRIIRYETITSTISIKINSKYIYTNLNLYVFKIEKYLNQFLFLIKYMK